MGGGDADQQNWPQDFGTPVFYNIIDKLSKGGMVSKRHEPTKTQYAYFKDGSGLGEFVFYFDRSGARSEKYLTTCQPQSIFPHRTSSSVSYDDAQSVCDKADYVNKELLGGLFVWEMTGDLMQNLVRSGAYPL